MSECPLQSMNMLLMLRCNAMNMILMLCCNAMNTILMLALALPFFE